VGDQLEVKTIQEAEHAFFPASFVAVSITIQGSIEGRRTKPQEKSVTRHLLFGTPWV
jgi:hypothetical protein